MNTARAKARRNKIIDIRARLNELNRARPYLKKEYYIARIEDLETALKEVGLSARKEEKIILQEEEDFVQYIELYE